MESLLERISQSRFLSVLLKAILLVFSYFVIWFITQWLGILPYANGGHDNMFHFAHSPRDQYLVYPPKIPDNLTFAGEKVPVHLFDVRESLDNEMLAIAFWHSNTFRFIKRANRYFPVIEPILDSNDVPNDFKYLALAESGLVADAVSPVGASGYWQFMSSTGKSYDLEINSAVDERYNLEKSTQAACQMLKDSYRKYKNWALVAAAYNYGSGNVDRQLEWQNVDNYYDLHLNSETARYLFRIIAIKLILETPQKHGFYFDIDDLYHPVQTYTVEVDSGIGSLVEFAQEHNTNYKVLRELNPWLRTTYLPNRSGKVYEIRLPAENVRRNYSRSGEVPLLPPPSEADSISADTTETELNTDSIEMNN